MEDELRPAETAAVFLKCFPPRSPRLLRCGANRHATTSRLFRMGLTGRYWTPRKWCCFLFLRVSASPKAILRWGTSGRANA
ncbi:hypothetical protein MTO96_039758 [Rhipicephalus appendiculatus]